MLHGKLIDLRKMRDSDLESFYDLYHGDVDKRGPFWPSGPSAFASLPDVKKRYQEDGFWKPLEKFSILLTVDKSDKLVGFVGFHPSMYDAYEIAWIIFDPQNRGKGYASEATRLLVGYMFDGMKLNRLEAYIHPDNAASRRLAEKCGLKYEATLREIWFQHGKYQDLTLYAITRQDFYAGESR
jgi:RimJ/RimL family protein N-acetyltransferase